MKILVYLPRSLGATILSFPFLGALKENFPTSQIALITPVQFSPLLEVLLPAYQQLPLPFIKDIPTLKNTSSKIKRAAFDVGILLDDSFSSALLLFLSRIPERWGYDREGRGFMLSRRLTLKATDPQLHLKDYFLNILKKIGLKSENSTFQWQMPTEISLRAEQKLIEFGLDPDKPLIIIKPGSSFGRSKVWPADYQIELIKKLLAANLQIALIGSSASREVSQRVSKAFDGQVADFCGQLQWSDIPGIMRRAKVFLGNDSGLTHLANVLGTPLVSLFGPTDPQICGPIFEPFKVLKKTVPCSPCSYRTCPYDHRCLNQISPEEVFQAITDFL